MKLTVAEQVAPELPYLRRFARALTGTQEAGDTHVLAMLEALVADSSSFRRDLPARAALYHAFLTMWNAAPLNFEDDETHVGSPPAIADLRLKSLTPLTRQAFLLATIEEFSTEEISDILSISMYEVAELLDEAGREISQQIAARVLIIEDEPLIALDIEMLVTDVGHEVVGIAVTRTEAVAFAENNKVGLVLADIQLADGSSGIDAVNDILTSVDVPVIFITAYPELLLTGKRAEPAFLISKPFKPEVVKAVISQALFFDVRAGKHTSRAA